MKLLKTPITILIVGEESTFKQEFITEKLNQLNSNILPLLRLEYIPEEDVQKYFYISDAVVLPYRSYFNGESGVLTDAIQMAKPVIVPNINHFPNIINKYNNGIVFRVEDPKDLAISIDNIFGDYKYYYENSIKASKQYVQGRQKIQISLMNFSKCLKTYFKL